MQSNCKQIGRVAPDDVNVLMLGENGTGKELVARAIYQLGQRSLASLLAINYAAIPEIVLESELFGHERDAFTGAGQYPASLDVDFAGFGPLGMHGLAVSKLAIGRNRDRQNHRRMVGVQGISQMLSVRDHSWRCCIWLVSALE